MLSHYQSPLATQFSLTLQTNRHRTDNNGACSNLVVFCFSVLFRLKLQFLLLIVLGTGTKEPQDVREMLNQLQQQLEQVKETTGSQSQQMKQLQQQLEQYKLMASKDSMRVWLSTHGRRGYGKFD